MASFGSKEFWEQWYNRTNEQPTKREWYVGYEQLEPILCEIIGKNDRVLMVGCGDSDLAQRMHEKGWKNILNIDFSQAVIEHMKQQQHHTTQDCELQYVVADVCELQSNEASIHSDPQSLKLCVLYQTLFGASSFDVILDKGTFDAILCSATAGEQLPKMFSNFKRYWFCHTFTMPH